MLPDIDLRRGGPLPLHEQLTSQLREQVLRGALPPGTRLPPTRRSAQALGVSRNVVLLAYEQLQLEGYLEARVGAGTRVRESLPAHLLHPDRIPSEDDRDAPGTETAPRLSRAGQRLSGSRGVRVLTGDRPRPFLPGVVAPEHFPVRAWSRVATAVWRTRTAEVVRYGETRGLAALRGAIADHLRRHRAVRCSAEQVLVTSGSQQALDLIARMLVDPEDTVAVEEPGYRGARIAFAATGARLLPVPVDSEGIVFPPEGIRETSVRLLYTTPSHQYPLGVTLTLARRLTLLEWARATGGWIVEDDYDSEFRYEGRPLPSLQGLDRGGRVIYVGTLSKVLSPGLRLGYVVLPEPLVEPFQGARAVTDAHSPLHMQATLAEFMTRGHLERHIARLRGVYGERRDCLREHLHARLGERLEVVEGKAGLHLTGFLPPGTDDCKVSRLAAERGVEAPPLSEYRLSPGGRPGLVLGFAPAPLSEIPGAVAALAAAVESA